LLINFGFTHGHLLLHLDEVIFSLKLFDAFTFFVLAHLDGATYHLVLLVDEPFTLFFLSLADLEGFLDHFFDVLFLGGLLDRYFDFFLLGLVCFRSSGLFLHHFKGLLV
jgi:hypothetical protein